MHKMRAEREDMGKTIEDFATFVGVDASTVWRWETQQSAPQKSKIAKVLEFFGGRLTKADLYG